MKLIYSPWVESQCLSGEITRYSRYILNRSHNESLSHISVILGEDGMWFAEDFDFNAYQNTKKFETYKEACVEVDKILLANTENIVCWLPNEIGNDVNRKFYEIEDVLLRKKLEELLMIYKNNVFRTLLCILSSITSSKNCDVSMQFSSEKYKAGNELHYDHTNKDIEMKAWSTRTL